MRTTTFALLAAAAVLMVPAIALADEPATTPTRGKSTEARADHSPATASHEDASNRSEALTAYLEARHALLKSWHENATKAREDCRATVIDRENATHDDRVAWAQCIRDAYRELRTDYRTQLKELKAELRLATGEAS